MDVQADGQPPNPPSEQEKPSTSRATHAQPSRTRAADPSCASSWSTSSDRQLGHNISPDTSDRVYPIRSAVSVDPTPRASEYHGYFPRLPDHGQYSANRPRNPRLDANTTDSGMRRTDSLPQPNSSAVAAPSDLTSRARRQNTVSGPLSSVQADAVRHSTSFPLPILTDAGSESEPDALAAEESASGSRRGASDWQQPPSDAGLDSHITTRFKHALTDEGHVVITGRDGVLQRCEDEPIHTPGAIQGFGLMLAIREEPDGRFTVRHASENSERLIGYRPQQLFRLANFLDILTDEQQDNLLDHIDFIRDEDSDPSQNGPEVFSLSVRAPKRKTVKLWCAIHINAAHPELVICEFELDDDHQYPMRPPDEQTPDIPEDTLQSDPTLEELTESTEILSKPLRVLRSARKRRGEAGAMQVFDIMSQVQDQLASAPNLEVFLKILVGIVKELTGFHRVMVYQFDSSFNGKVVTELVDTTHTRDLYKGLHFPASDIPRQARDLYKLNKVRLLYDRDLETARLVCRSKEDLEVPLDMSHAYLRAMSPIHLKYLANMAVRSSMSISINAFNELWGLIACHSYGSQGMRVSFPIRKMCRLVGDTASRTIERLSYASRLQARKLINTAPTDKNPSGYIIASSDDLLRLFDADFGLLSIQGETKILGKIDQAQEALAMLEYLRMRKITSVITSQDIRDDFRDLRYLPGFIVIAGLLYVPLSVGGSDFIVFFRKGQVKDVKWAGNPYDKMIREGTAQFLEPRKSFKTWHETVVGKCRDWSEEQVETAAVLCLVYGKFIEVWRQKEAALQSSRLTRLLLANSAHEVRTPLNAIINYLEIALEGTLDQETRDNLAKSHSASKSLIYVINDLLDLTKTEEGQNLVKDDIFDLSACIREATDPFVADARRKDIQYEVIEHPGLPRYVLGDSRRLRQAVSNVTANAVQHTITGSVKVELYVAEIMERRVRVEIVVQDTGKGMSSKELDTLFRDLEQVTTDSDERGFSAQDGDRPVDGRILGLGLAMVARIVRNMDGQLRLKSKEQVGSRFTIQLPFDIPEDSPEAPGDPNVDPQSTTASSLATIVTSIPPDITGEITLVDRGSVLEKDEGAGEQAQQAEIMSMDSSRSVASRASQRSIHSTRSDADRLIDAIQTPLSLGDVVGTESPGGKRKNSREKATHSTLAGPSGTTMGQSTNPAAASRRNRSPTGKAVMPSEEVGYTSVVDTKTPLRPIKIPDEYFDQSTRSPQAETSRVLFEITDRATDASMSESGTAASVTSATERTRLRVLVAEDDPINMKILRKRLEKAGHDVCHTLNGEECATVYGEHSKSFDIVLMDMQMPIVDGLTSTKMIRASEQSDSHGGHSPLALHNGRIPIFAVSASLVEREKVTYISAGFDGWILKPIDFKRLTTLLHGSVDDEIRAQCLYTPGQWEKGGWFGPRSEHHDQETPQVTPKISENEQ